jgi:hypothetical protein
LEIEVNKPATYQTLFSRLVSLGFEEREIAADGAARSFVHPETDAVLLFRRPVDDPVTSADMLSTEVHLQGKGITDQTLEVLLAESVLSK